MGCKTHSLKHLDAETRYKHWNIHSRISLHHCPHYNIIYIPIYIQGSSEDLRRWPGLPKKSSCPKTPPWDVLLLYFSTTLILESEIIGFHLFVDARDPCGKLDPQWHTHTLRGYILRIPRVFVNSTWRAHRQMYIKIWAGVLGDSRRELIIYSQKRLLLLCWWSLDNPLFFCTIHSLHLKEQKKKSSYIKSL